MTIRFRVSPSWDWVIAEHFDPATGKIEELYAGHDTPGPLLKAVLDREGIVHSIHEEEME